MFSGLTYIHINGSHVGGTFFRTLEDRFPDLTCPELCDCKGHKGVDVVADLVLLPASGPICFAHCQHRLLSSLPSTTAEFSLGSVRVAPILGLLGSEETGS